MLAPQQTHLTLAGLADVSRLLSLSSLSRQLPCKTVLGGSLGHDAVSGP